VAQAHLREFARHAQCAQLRLHGAKQIVRREAVHRGLGGARSPWSIASRSVSLLGWVAPPCRAARLRKCAGNA
jgi:hypothetical protein